MRFIIAFLALTASGCATVLTGTTQEIAITTEPTGADCILTREGAEIAKAAPTPQTVTIEKARADIAVACALEGFTDATGTLTSSIQDATYGNILAGGIIGAAVDSSTGASRIYPESLNLVFEPLPEAEPGTEPEPTAEPTS
ncbi:MAG: hypothetical protein AAF908_11125 [Pseudomonadota bacterium]